ncbi:hypothetical protein C1877_01095 [Gordonibacter pamelaeae]|uniref:Uncharacterized protein n=1 Tax=Gordonibacter pamelaeae TaxID=471189 RepID=A0A369M5Q0_9ACTN|nr:hypothetical protein C1877_01095 [Gordonibacter pamelaeae]
MVWEGHARRAREEGGEESRGGIARGARGGREGGARGGRGERTRGNGRGCRLLREGALRLLAFFRHSNDSFCTGSPLETVPWYVMGEKR